MRGHYVPKFYLKGFTKNEDERGPLFVLDMGRMRQWQSTPHGSASERDMYAVNPQVADGDDQAVEKLFSQWEGKFNVALRMALADGKLPSGEQWSVLLNFMALSAIRGPSFRSLLNDFTGRLIKGASQVMFSTPAGWRWFENAVKAQGGSTEGLSPEHMRAFIKDAGTAISVDQTSYVQFLLNAANKVLPFLVQRQWTLLNVIEEAPDLICSDTPVSVTGKNKNTPHHALGFGMPDTIVTFPLNRRTMLIGVFGERLPPIPLNKLGVAYMNSATRHNAQQLYSSEQEFVWIDSDLNVRTATQMLAALRETRKW